MINAKTNASSKPSRLPIFATFYASMLQEIDTRKVRQVMRASLAVTTYVEEKPYMLEFVFIFFHVGKSFVALINVGPYRRRFSTQHSEAFLLCWKSQPIRFWGPNVLYSTAIIKKAFQVTVLNCSRSCSTETLSRYTVQKISKVWTALAVAANLAPLVKLVSPYNLFDSKMNRYLGLNRRDQGFALCDQSLHQLHG